MRLEIACAVFLIATSGLADEKKRQGNVILDEGIKEGVGLLFPVVGSVQGNNGTYFRSDITISNHRPVDQPLTLIFHPRGVNNSVPGVIQIEQYTLGGNRWVVFRDIVGKLFKRTGLGMLTVVAVDAAGNSDPTGLIDGTSRIYTLQPGSTGSVSQSLPALPLGDMKGDAPGFAFGLRQDASFRTNVGVVNFDLQPRTFVIAATGVTGKSASTTVTVQPYSMDQVPAPAGDYGEMLITVQPSSQGFTTDAWWSAYATSVDNVTGDSWIVHAAP